MKKGEPIYVVHMQRWGDNGSHAYVAGAATQLSQAKGIALHTSAKRLNKETSYASRYGRRVYREDYRATEVYMRQ